MESRLLIDRLLAIRIGTRNIRDSNLSPKRNDAAPASATLSLQQMEGRSTRGGHGGFGRCTFFSIFHRATLVRQQMARSEVASLSQRARNRRGLRRLGALYETSLVDACAEAHTKTASGQASHDVAIEA